MPNDPSGALGDRQEAGSAAAANEAWRALLLPLARTQNTLARLETAAATASEGVREGLVARRDAGLIGAWGVAAHVDRLAPAVPATAEAARSDNTGAVDHEVMLDGVPDDRLVGHALLLARRWHALAEPEVGAGAIADPDRDALRRALAALDWNGIEDDAWRGWVALMGEEEGLPPLQLAIAAEAARRAHEELRRLQAAHRLTVWRLRPR